MVAPVQAREVVSVRVPGKVSRRVKTVLQQVPVRVAVRVVAAAAVRKILVVAQAKLRRKVAVPEMAVARKAAAVMVTVKRPRTHRVVVERIRPEVPVAQAPVQPAPVAAKRVMAAGPVVQVHRR